MLKGPRIIGETLAVEAGCLAAGFVLWVHVLDPMRLGGSGLFLFAVLAVIPAPIYAGWRSPELSLGGGAVTGAIVSVAMIAFTWTQSHLNPCPAGAFECRQYLGAYLVTFFAVIVVLPAFLAPAPVAGPRLRAARPEARIDDVMHGARRWLAAPVPCRAQDTGRPSRS